MQIDGNVVVIGGGTGSFTILTALRHHCRSITAIVNMADDGGSTGVLRDELGVLPPGDVRQCLVALSDAPELRDLFNYRFEDGTFGGHAFGNILLTALEKTTGSFAEAVEQASNILRVDGTVIPATLDDVRLIMSWPGDPSATLRGEKIIDAEHFTHDPTKAILSLEPNPVLNPRVTQAIKEADCIIIAPGDLYTSLGPLLVINGVGRALHASNAKKIYVTNLVSKDGQTDGLSVEGHRSEIERFAGHAFLDAVLYNTQVPDTALAKRYEQEKAFLVTRDSEDSASFWIGAELLGGMTHKEKSDRLPVTRSYIRHDTNKVIQALLEYYNGRS